VPAFSFKLTLWLFILNISLIWCNSSTLYIRLHYNILSLHISLIYIIHFSCNSFKICSSIVLYLLSSSSFMIRGLWIHALTFGNDLRILKTNSHYNNVCLFVYCTNVAIISHDYFMTFFRYSCDVLLLAASVYNSLHYKMQSDPSHGFRKNKTPLDL